MELFTALPTKTTPIVLVEFWMILRKTMKSVIDSVNKRGKDYIVMFRGILEQNRDVSYEGCVFVNKRRNKGMKMRLETTNLR